MTHEHAREKKPFDPGDYPALREFFPAYLHQDFAEEYGSAAGAVKGFLAEASGDEILEMREEWKALSTLLRTQSLQERQAALEIMGSAWRPETEEEWKELDAMLLSAES